MSKEFYDLLKDRHTVYWLTIIAIILEIFAAWFDANKKNKISTMALRGIALCLLAYIIYLCSGDDEIWRKDVTRLQRLDSVLDHDIDSMSYVNHEIDSSTQDMVNKDGQLTAYNLKLTQDADTITRRTEKLTLASKSISERLDTKTDQEFEITGEFNFPIDSTCSTAIVNSLAGTMKGGQFNMNEVRFERRALFSFSNLRIDVFSWKFIINAKIYDLRGNLIVEIEENRWRLNKNAVSKFNYDSKGFEVFDNTGRVALNVNFAIRGNRKSFAEIYVQVQGILPEIQKRGEAAIFVNDRYLITLPYGTRELNEKVREVFDLHPIEPLFKYVGKNWRHVRNV